MKIISRGVIPETVPVRAECSHCKTVVEFLPSEARYVPDQRDGSFWMVGCPVCSRQIMKGAH